MIFVDKSKGYLLAEKGIICKTVDGGENWNFLFKDTTLYISHSIIATRDSIFCFGIDFLGRKRKVSFHKDSKSGSSSIVNYYVKDPVFNNNVILFINGIALCRYYNGIVDTLFFWGEYFYAKNNFISVGSSTKVFISDDFGKTWEAKQFINSPLSSEPYTCYYSMDTILAITNYATTLHYSFDRGISWKHIPEPPLNFFFIDGIHLLALNMLGTDNRVYSSSNSGQSFREEVVEYHLKYCYFFSNKLGFIFGEKGTIYKSNNIIY